MSSKNLLLTLGLCCATQTLFSGSEFQNLFADHKALDIKGAPLYSYQDQQAIIASKIAAARGLQWTGGLGVAGYLGYALKGKIQRKPMALLFPTKHKIGSATTLITGLLGWYWERQLQGKTPTAGEHKATPPGTNPTGRPVAQVTPPALERPEQKIAEVKVQVAAYIAEHQAAQGSQEERPSLEACWGIARTFYKVTQAKVRSQDEIGRMLHRLEAAEQKEIKAAQAEDAELPAQRISDLVTSAPILEQLTKLVNLYEKNQAKRATLGEQGKKIIDAMNDEIAILFMNLRLDTFDANYSMTYQTSPALEDLFRRIDIEKYQTRIAADEAFSDKHLNLRITKIVRYQKHQQLAAVQDDFQEPDAPGHFDRKAYEARLAEETARGERKKEREQKFAEEEKKAAGQAAALPAYQAWTTNLTQAQQNFLRNGWLAARVLYHEARTENPTMTQEEAFNLVQGIINGYKALDGNRWVIPARAESAILLVSLFIDTMRFHNGDLTSPFGQLFNQPLVNNDVVSLNLLEGIDNYDLIRNYCLLGINPDNGLPNNDDEHQLLNIMILNRGEVGPGLNERQRQRGRHLFAAYQQRDPAVIAERARIAADAQAAAPRNWRDIAGAAGAAAAAPRGGAGAGARAARGRGR